MLNGIGLHKEASLWSEGIQSWADLRHKKILGLSEEWRANYISQINEFELMLKDKNYLSLFKALPLTERWRVLDLIYQDCIYFDVEMFKDHKGVNISTIVALDDEGFHVFIKGKNLQEAKEYFSQGKPLVTFGGTRTDIPVLQHILKMSIQSLHIDVKLLLAQIGLSGGLKKIEKQLKTNRYELQHVSGKDASAFWKDYQDNKQEKALETLVLYNAMDTAVLPSLLVYFWNQKVNQFDAINAKKLNKPKLPKFNNRRIGEIKW